MSDVVVITGGTRGIGAAVARALSQPGTTLVLGYRTLTRGLALEVAGQGIRVNAVRPGIIDTDFHAAAGDATRASRLASSQPMGRCGTAGEVADAIVWLLSEQASYITGTTLDVSGGR